MKVADYRARIAFSGAAVPGKIGGDRDYLTPLEERPFPRRALYAEAPSDSR